MAKNNTDVVGLMEEWFAKLPNLPKNIQDVLAKIAPILALVFGVLGLLAGIAGLGALTAFLPLAFLGGYMGYGGGYVAAIFLIAASALMLAAFPQLRAYKYAGWNLLFWSEAVTVVGNLLSGDIIGALVGGAISFYLLFQIRSYFK